MDAQEFFLEQAKTELFEFVIEGRPLTVSQLVKFAEDYHKMKGQEVEDTTLNK